MATEDTRVALRERPPLPLCPLERCASLSTVLQFCDQAALRSASRACSTLYHAVVDDLALACVIKRVHSLGQIRAFLKPGYSFFCAEYYTNIAQRDGNKPPYTHTSVVTSVEKGDRLRFDTLAADGKVQSTSFSEISNLSMSDHRVTQVTMLNADIELLCALQDYVRSEDIGRVGLPFLRPNCERAIRFLKRMLLDDGGAAVRRATLLRISGEPWREECLGLPSVMAGEDLAFDAKVVQDVRDEEVGQPPLYSCWKCEFVLGGLTCDSPAFSSEPRCGERLQLQADGSMACAQGCGACPVPWCCDKPMKARAMPATHTAAGGGVSMSCEQCKFAVNGASCFHASHGTRGELLHRNGFFERVWCAYVWTCPDGCGRAKRGGTYGRATLECSSCVQQSARSRRGAHKQQAQPLSSHEYISQHGEPCNY